MNPYQKPEIYAVLESSEGIVIDASKQAIWFSENALAKLAGTTRQDINKKMQLIKDQRGEDYFATKTCKLKPTGSRQRIG